MRLSRVRWAAAFAGLALLTVLAAIGNGAAVAQTGGQDDFGSRLESLRGEGRYSEAIAVLKRAIAAEEARSGLDTSFGVTLLNNLGELHYKLGLYAEAIPIYERGLAIADRTIKADTPLTAILLRNLATVYQLQGRRGDAARLYARSIQQLDKLMPETAIDLATTLNNLGTLYQDAGRLQEAEQLLVRALKTYRDGLPAGHLYISTGLHNLGRLYERQGDYVKAEQAMTEALRNLDLTLARDHPQRAPVLRSLGLIYAAKKDWGKAVDPLREALAIYQRQARRGAQSLQGELSGLPSTHLAIHKAAAGDFVNSAMKLVTVDRSRGVELVAHVLEAAQSFPSEASASLAQMSARRVKGDGPLAALARERQDLVAEWQARDKRLLGRLTRRTSVDAEAHAADTARLAEIDRRLADIDQRLAREFPEYTALINPQPLTAIEIQAVLRDDEAMVVFIETPSPSWAWVISKTDKNLSLVNLGSGELAPEVAALRCGLDPLDWTDPAGWPAEMPGDMQRKQQQERRVQRCRSLFPRYAGGASLPFDARRAHALYKALLGSAEQAIAGKHLLIVPSASLMQLPFGTLVTEMPAVAVPDDAQGYHGVQWLGTRQAITILPSVASLAVLRRNARPVRARKPWAGFGNPLLDGQPGNQADSQRAGEARSRQSCGLAPQRTRLAARGSRAAASVLLHGTLADVGQVRRQAPLPETADELCDVGRRLGAADDDIWLGARATEAAVKSLSARGVLEGYATLHFATHGLIAGNLSGLGEPALMLTPPATPSEEDDGLLTASEVTGLKLDADWVVLSACNSAAGGAEGAQALSGLARAFFYAGARALLVSHWEVESDAAVALTTGAFAAAEKDHRIGRAEALRRSMLAFSTDRANPRNAHPSVWAPFVPVGEGGL